MNLDFLNDLIGEEATGTIATLVTIAGILLITWLIRKALDTLLPARTSSRISLPGTSRSGSHPTCVRYPTRHQVP